MLQDKSEQYPATRSNRWIVALLGLGGFSWPFCFVSFCVLFLPCSWDQGMHFKREQTQAFHNLLLPYSYGLISHWFSAYTLCGNHSQSLMDSFLLLREACSWALIVQLLLILQDSDKKSSLAGHLLDLPSKPSLPCATGRLPLCALSPPHLI